MKSISLLFILLFVFTKSATYAQEADCSMFCVTNIQLDSLSPGFMNVTIQFSSDDTLFINYPHVSAVINELGDTVATGTLNFFGQISNTTLDYPVETDLQTIPENFNAYVVFNYDTSTCILSYPCIINNTRDEFDLPDLSIYPNPFSIETTLQTNENLDGLDLTLLDIFGHPVITINKLVGNQVTLKRNSLPAGIYFLYLSADDKPVSTRRVVIVD